MCGRKHGCSNFTVGGKTRGPRKNLISSYLNQIKVFLPHLFSHLAGEWTTNKHFNRRPLMHHFQKSSQKNDPLVHTKINHGMSKVCPRKLICIPPLPILSIMRQNMRKWKVPFLISQTFTKDWLDLENDLTSSTERKMQKLLGGWGRQRARTLIESSKIENKISRG